MTQHHPTDDVQADLESLAEVFKVEKTAASRLSAAVRAFPSPSGTSSRSQASRTVARLPRLRSAALDPAPDGFTAIGVEHLIALSARVLHDLRGLPKRG